MTAWRQLESITLAAGEHLASALAQADAPAPAAASILCGPGQAIPFAPRDSGERPRIRLIIASSGGATDLRLATETAAGGAGSPASSAAVVGAGETWDAGPLDALVWARRGALVVGAGATARVTVLIAGAWGAV